MKKSVIVCIDKKVEEKDEVLFQILGYIYSTLKSINYEPIPSVNENVICYRYITTSSVVEDFTNYNTLIKGYMVCILEE